MKKRGRFRRKFFNIPTVLILLTIGMILWYGNGPGARKYLPKIIFYFVNKKPGHSVYFNLKGSILGGFTVNNLDCYFSDQYVVSGSNIAIGVNWFRLIFQNENMAWVTKIESKSEDLFIFFQDPSSPPEPKLVHNLLRAELNIKTMEFDGLYSLQGTGVSIQSERRSLSVTIEMENLFQPKSSKIPKSLILTYNRAHDDFELIDTSTKARLR